MPMIDCHECGARISDQAIACPACGAPRRRDGDAPGVVTTQQTARRLKAWQLVASFVVAFGVVLIIAGQHLTGVAVSCAGLAAYLIARFRAWWRHG